MLKAPFMMIWEAGMQMGQSRKECLDAGDPIQVKDEEINLSPNAAFP